MAQAREKFSFPEKETTTRQAKIYCDFKEAKFITILGFKILFIHQSIVCDKITTWKSVDDYMEEQNH